MEKQASNNKMIIIAVSVVLSILIFVIAAIFAIKIMQEPAELNSVESIGTMATAGPIVNPNAETYLKATDLYNQQNYAEAAKLFSQSANYQDAEHKANVCKYQQALALYRNKKYDASLMLLKEITNLAEANTLKNKCNDAKKDVALYKKAKSKYKNGKHSEAIKLLGKVKNYAPAKELKKKAEIKKKNMPPAKPDVNEFADITSPIGDGSTYEVTWNKVSGATGYQYSCTQEINYPDGTVDDAPYYEQKI